jgi:hypothetical protein
LQKKNKETSCCADSSSQQKFFHKKSFDLVMSEKPDNCFEESVAVKIIF